MIHQLFIVMRIITIIVTDNRILKREITRADLTRIIKAKKVA